MKTCTLCNTEKPFSDFSPNIKMRDGYVNQCRKCRYQRRVSTPERRALKAANQRRWQLKSFYGLTEDQYWTQYTMQGGKCAICKMVNADGRALAVDHDHVTNQPRMLLCSNCNLVVGNCDESIEILEATIKYLQLMRSKGLSTVEEVSN